MNVPDDLRYTSDHEWVRPAETPFRIGLTDFAQDALGDVVFVQLPAVGTVVEKGGPLSEVESTKSVSQVYSPVSGTVVEANEELRNSPELLNSAPYGDGWICAIEATDPGELDALMGPEEYRSTTDA